MGLLRWRAMWMSALLTVVGLLWLAGPDLLQAQGPAAPASPPAAPAAPAAPAPPAHASPAPTATSTPAAPGANLPVDPSLPSFLDLFNTSVVINAVIIGLSVIALVLFIYFLLTINYNTMAPAAFIDDVMKMVLDRDYKGAVDFCRHHRGIFVSSIIQRCIENVDKEHAVLMNILDTEGKRRADILWNRISYLGDISNVAPMLGLLGTITGMMGAFFGMQEQDITLRSRYLTSQIGGAMATTFFGLIVAIAALIFYSLVKSRLTKVLSESEAAVHAITDHLKRGEG
jgi:biopolymer transport protein ExbB